MDHSGYKTVCLFIKTDPNGTGFRDNYPNQYNLYCGLGLSFWLHVLRGDNCDSLIKKLSFIENTSFIDLPKQILYRKCCAGTRAGQTVRRIEKVGTWNMLEILQLG